MLLTPEGASGGHGASGTDADADTAEAANAAGSGSGWRDDGAAGGCLARPRHVPDDIAAWFDRQAARTLQEDADHAVVIDEEFAPVQYGEVTVGRPRPIYSWSEAFRAGEGIDTPLAAPSMWGAPYTGDGVPAGTIAAWHDDGVAGFAYAEDNAVLAAALDRLPAEARWVEEPMLGAHFAVVGDEVHTLHATWYGEPGTVLPLAAFQPLLVGWVAEATDAAVPAPPDVPSSRWLPLGLAALGAVLLAAVVAVLRVARRAAP